MLLFRCFIYSSMYYFNYRAISIRSTWEESFVGSFDELCYNSTKIRFMFPIRSARTMASATWIECCKLLYHQSYRAGFCTLNVFGDWLTHYWFDCVCCQKYHPDSGPDSGPDSSSIMRIQHDRKITKLVRFIAFFINFWCSTCSC